MNNAKCRKSTEKLKVMGASLCKRRPNHKWDPEDAIEVRAAFLEMVETEAIYGKELEQMSFTYLTPLKTENLFFDHREIMDFSHSLQEIIKTSDKFERELEAIIRKEPKRTFKLLCKVCNLFMKLEENFYKYRQYANLGVKVEYLIRKNSNLHKLIGFMSEGERTTDKMSSPPKETHSENMCAVDYSFLLFQAFTSKPCQRLSYYSVVLNRLQEKCKQGTEDQRRLLVALEMIRKVMEFVEEEAKMDGADVGEG